MWIAFWAIYAFSPIFGPENQNFWQKEKNTWIYHHFNMDPKNHDHLIDSSLKMMPKAWQVSLGQFLSFYSIFDPKLKFSKNEKMPETY